MIILAEATAGYYHPRATIDQLRAQFNGGVDRPSHWYEAQLIHYGLASSRSKGTAKMRLQDAVREKQICLPDYVRQVEEDLRREWKIMVEEGVARRQREIAKRKRHSSDDWGVTGQEPWASKRCCIEPDTPAIMTQHRTSDTLPQACPFQACSPLSPRPHRGCGETTAIKGAGINNLVKRELDTTDLHYIPRSTWMPFEGESVPGSTTPWIDSALRQPASLASAPPVYGSRSASSDKRRTCQSPLGLGFILNKHADAAVPIKVAPDHNAGNNTARKKKRLPRLGLIDGRYDINVVPPTDMRRHSLALSADDSTVWGHLELGGLTGVIRIGHRPHRASMAMYGLAWRGHYITTSGAPQFHDGTRPGEGQYLSFLGGNEIRGRVNLGRGSHWEFTGQRVSASGMGSGIGGAEMRRWWQDLAPRL